MKRPKVSVIIPVYNAEKYLNRCIDSVLAQTFSDFELLLIDDGSKDRSGEICEEYAATNSRVCVFHKDNGGVSSARNVGIDNAKGMWLIFLDSDDWIDNSYLKKIYECANRDNFDIVSTDYYLEITTQANCLKKENPTDNKDSIIRNLLTNHAGGYLWNKLIKADLFNIYRIRFPEGIGMWEDLVVSLKLYLVAKQVRHIPIAFYHYNLYNVGSAISNMTEEKIEQKIKVCKLIEESLSSMNVLKDYLEELYIRQLIAKLDYVSEQKFFNVKKWRMIFPESSKYWKKLDTPKKIRIQLCFVYNGFSCLAYVLFYFKIRPIKRLFHKVIHI